MIEDFFEKISIPNSKLRKLVESYLDAFQNSSTKRARMYALESFLEFHKTRKSFEFQVEDIQKYKRYLEKNKSKKQLTVKNYLSALRIFFDHLKQNQIISKNPANRVQYSYKPIVRQEIFLEGNKLESLFKVPENIIDMRNQALVLVLIYTNLDDKDICTIRSNEIEKEGRSFYILGQKLGKRANKIIKEYLKKLKKEYNSNYVFINFGVKNHKLPISPRNIKEIYSRELKKLGIEKDYFKVLTNTKYFLQFKNHRSAKKLREENSISKEKYESLIEEFQRYFESSD